MNTTTYLLHRLPLGVAAFDLGYLCAQPQLNAPAELLVGYAFSAARQPALYLPNGDPGDEPGQHELLDILLIESGAPLHLSDRDNGVLVTLVAGYGRDLRNYFTEEGLLAIEVGVLKELRADAGQDRVDAYLDRQP